MTVELSEFVQRGWQSSPARHELTEDLMKFAIHEKVGCDPEGVDECALEFGNAIMDALLGEAVAWESTEFQRGVWYTLMSLGDVMNGMWDEPEALTMIENLHDSLIAMRVALAERWLKGDMITKVTDDA
jgi:hypothetical protein